MGGDAVTTWLADWSDLEDAAFHRAWADASLDVRVLRGRPLGTTTGRRRHRLRSYPTYAALAARGWSASRRGPVVTWQPLVGALLGYLPARRCPMVVLNPLLDLEAGGPRLKAIVAGVRRADAVVFYSRGARDDAIGLGIDPDRAVFLPLGVAARVTRPDPPGTFLLATGKDRRDWETLAEAAHGLDSEVLVAGPAPSQVPAPLRVVRPGSREAYLDLVARAAAVVIPLVDGHRQAGQLALLDAFSLGRGVVASRGRGTEDYVTAERGVLVDPGDPDALRVAMQQVLDPIVSTELGAGAFRAIQGELSILNFVEGVAAQVDRSIVRRRRDGPR